MTNDFDPEDGNCQCGGHAVKRTNRTTGVRFWGCSNFPKCRNTQPIVTGQPGTFLLSSEDEMAAYYNAFYDGDG